ncbi:MULTISPECIES: hypothetical protein [unclassified Lacrimispora]|uniref:hypothetical protein n=1 Tax=unclassified Lacrimispora TaxID=2719232 RepID=UPI00305BD26D|nr:hypothetical protein [Lachnospiraceae bacterium]
MNFDFKDLMTFGMFILALLTFIFSNVFQIPEMGTENRPCKNIGVFRAAICRFIQANLLYEVVVLYLYYK